MGENSHGQKAGSPPGRAPGWYLHPPYDWTNRKGTKGQTELQVVGFNRRLQALLSAIPALVYACLQVPVLPAHLPIPSLFEFLLLELIPTFSLLLVVSYLVQYGFRVHLHIDPKGVRLTKKWWALTYAYYKIPEGRLDICWDTPGLELVDTSSDRQVIATFGTARCEDAICLAFNRALFPKEPAEEFDPEGLLPSWSRS